MQTTFKKTWAFLSLISTFNIKFCAFACFEVHNAIPGQQSQPTQIKEMIKIQHFHTQVTQLADQQN